MDVVIAHLVFVQYVGDVIFAGLWRKSTAPYDDTSGQADLGCRLWSCILGHVLIRLSSVLI